MSKIVMSMKKHFFITLMCALVTFANANTIHWITFVDTTDPSVGSIDATAQKYLYSQWIDVVNAALAEKNYSSKIYNFSGSQTTPENCKEAIGGLKCDSNDVVIFYYIGHGGRSITDKSKYPQMFLAQNADEKCVPLVWVYNELMKKNARLTLTIGMCCNSFTSGMSAKESVPFSVERGRAMFSGKEVESIQKLFLGHRGNIIMSSSSIGQVSWGGYIPAINSSMDIFTYNFIKAFKTYVNNTTDPSWHLLCQRVSTDVNNMSIALSQVGNVKKQTPIFDVDVQKCSFPAKRQDTTPNPPIDEIKNDNEMAQKLTTYFDYIVNATNPLPERIKKANALKGVCVKDAIVRTLGADTDEVIDRQKISDFLDIVSASKRYYKIVVKDIKLDERDYVVELKVKEYIKKQH